MIIQIDQSGKIEKTSVLSVIGFSNGKQKALSISADEKQKIQHHFRELNKPKVYVFKSFAAIIYLLIKDEPVLDLIIIDTEYPGQDALIKGYLLNLLHDHGRTDITKRSIVFKPIGKASPAHSVVYRVYKGLDKSKAVTASDLIKLIN